MADEKAKDLGSDPSVDTARGETVVKKATLSNPVPEHEAMLEDDPVDDELQQEPPKPIPNPGDDGYDTPSGRAVAVVGQPDVENPDSDKERKRARNYRRIKELMRRGPGIS